jgi:protein disulfide-isomerase
MRLLPLLSLFIAYVPLFAVRTGDSLESVIGEMGQPRSRMQTANTIVLTYEHKTIRLVDGKVVSQASHDTAVTGLQKPAATATPEPSRTSPQKPKPQVEAAGGGEWNTNYEAAMRSARGTGRKVLLLFTGSDWCGWCIRLEREILDTDTFRQYAGENLVLIKLDFPRSIQQTQEVKRQNATLQSKYGIEGYPTVVVVNDSGEEIGRLGYTRGGPDAFIAGLRKL